MKVASAPAASVATDTDLVPSIPPIHPETPGRSAHPTASSLLARWGVIFGFLALLIFFSLMRPDTFATWQNAKSILNATPILVIFGCIVTTAMVLGEFDISFPYLADLTSVIVAVLVTTGGMDAGLGLAAALALAIGASVVAGCITGTLVASAR